MTIQNPNTNACCQGISLETPVKIYNRPGLSAICYRVGDYARFRESLLAGISRSAHPALHKLSSRSQDDFSIALLDAWSAVADILTFYQERIANESYLGTATEQLSVLELARLIGYELRPGVAASTYLAFTLETVPGQLLLSPQEKSQADIPPVTIESGTKVQSTPGPGEKAQTFETIQSIQARSEWNAMTPLQAQIQSSVSENKIIVVNGTANDLHVGDIVLVHSGLKAKKIVKIDFDNDAKTTLLYLKSGATIPTFSESVPEPDGKVTDIPEKTELTGSVVNTLLSKTWKMEDLETLIKTQGWSETALRDSFTEATQIQAAGGLLSVFRKKTAPFGFNALKQVTYDGSVPKIPSLWQEWSLDESNSRIFLDTANNEILPGSYAAVQKSGESLENAIVYSITDAEVQPRTAYGMSAKTTGLTINSSQAWWDTSKTDLAALRSLTIHAQSEALGLAGSKIPEDISGDTITLSGLYLGLKTGSMVILTGERADLKGTLASETKALKKILVTNGLTVLIFEEVLEYSYIRSSVTINANVALATHGETVAEVLGSGDASAVFQEFKLKQNPLTFISSTSSSGTESTLEIRVNNILWHEVPSFYDKGPDEHIFITRLDDEGNTTVMFGDGKTGSRLPTGQENIRATYRKGIGSAGILKANQLSQLMTRPLGVKSATNPIASSGGQDAEALDEARRNATLTIFTLDRVVSLKDYEDYARAFAGISKSLATWTWTGRKRQVYLTVAGTDGAEVETGSTLFENLLKSIHDAGVPRIPVTMASYQPRFFKVSAKVGVDPDYVPDNVLDAVESALRDTFSFDKRNFGQAVAYSEVIAVMQKTEGVIAVDVDEFYRSDESPDLNDRLFADIPRAGSETANPAELLMIDPSPVNLTLMT